MAEAVELDGGITASPMNPSPSMMGQPSRASVVLLASPSWLLASALRSRWPMTFRKDAQEVRS